MIDEKTINALSFYVPSLVGDNLKVVLNRDHNFYQKVYQPLFGAERVEPALVLEHLQLLLLAAVGRSVGCGHVSKRRQPKG